MKTIRYTKEQLTFGSIIQIPESCSEHPAMLLQLHGAGERGNGSTDLDAVLVHGFPNVVNDTNLKDCILVMPQCPEDTFWVARIESLKKYIDEIVQLYQVDTDRIYLCGLSMGGFGTWYLAMAYPDLFAAIAPCCGGGMPWNAWTLHMPVWAFHGKEDTVVNPFHSIEMVESLKNTNVDVKFDLYENVGHDSWVRAFQEELLEWFYTKRK